MRCERLSYRGFRFARRGAIAGGALAFLATAALLAPGAAQAASECGALNSGNSFTETCADSNSLYTSGIEYSNVAGAPTLTVTGGSATTVTAASRTGSANWNRVGAIVVTTAAQGMGVTASRAISLTVGSGSNAVAIAEHSTASNSGVLVHQNGNQATDATTVTVGSGVTIGTSSAPMRKYGVWLLATGNTANTGAQNLYSTATIHSTEYGLLVDNRGAGNSSCTTPAPSRRRPAAAPATSPASASWTGATILPEAATAATADTGPPGPTSPTPAPSP